MQEKHIHKEAIEKNNYKIINCKTCGYWHVHPKPQEEELRLYYEKKYYNTLDNNRSMTDKLNDPDGFYLLQYEDRLRSIVRYLARNMPLSVLDIAAGYGDFLRFMSKQGWKTQGLELSRQAYEFIKDREALNIIQGSIDDLSKPDFKPASVVTLNNVLEHLRNPCQILEVIRQKLLLQGGIIMVIVPNDFNPLQYLINRTILKNNREKQYYWIAPPDHLNYWSIRTFKRFLRKNGFKILHYSTDFPMEFFPLVGEDYITYPEIGRGVHLKRVKFEKYFHEAKSFALKDSLYKTFARQGIGRDMQFIITPQ